MTPSLVGCLEIGYPKFPAVYHHFLHESNGCVGGVDLRFWTILDCWFCIQWSSIHIPLNPIHTHISHEYLIENGWTLWNHGKNQTRRYSLLGAERASRRRSAAVTKQGGAPGNSMGKFFEHPMFYMYISWYVSTYMCICICKYTYIYICIHMCIYMYVYI